PALAFPSVSLTNLAVAAISNDPEQIKEFYRSDLGLPYEPKGSRVTETMLRQLSHELPGGELPEMQWRKTTMGVDVGTRLHYRISSTGEDGKRYVREMGAVHNWEELDPLIKSYRIRRVVIDALPEIHKCQEWQEKHKGIVIRAFYPKTAGLKGKLFQPEPDQIEDVIQINR